MRFLGIKIKLDILVSVIMPQDETRNRSTEYSDMAVFYVIV
jgi:hypothetical protein